MAFQVITDMALADEYWQAGLLYYTCAGEWVLDTYYLLESPEWDWRPSRDASRDDPGNEYAIYVED